MEDHANGEGEKERLVIGMPANPHSAQRLGRDLHGIRRMFPLYGSVGTPNHFWVDGYKTKLCDYISINYITKHMLFFVTFNA